MGDHARAPYFLLLISDNSITYFALRSSLFFTRRTIVLIIWGIEKVNKTLLQIQVLNLLLSQNISEQIIVENTPRWRVDC
jgi:hypothetical protein